MKVMRRFSNRIMMDTSSSLSKYKGSLLGVLLGDCCGAPFEGEILESGDRVTLRKYFDKLEGSFFKAPQKKYTDDTAMTMSVAECLIEDKDIISKNLAMKFTKSYYEYQHRGYGANIVNIFQKLRLSKFDDPLLPAKEQFGGAGSYGNGAAMRVSPVSLFCFNKPLEKLKELVVKSAEVTHTHELGINGAILHALALNQVLALSQTNAGPLDKNGFIDYLIAEMSKVEQDDSLKLRSQHSNYQKQLQEVKKLIQPDTHVSDEEIVNILGHSIAALYSVPTAIYCFLRAQEQIDGIKANNPFRRTLEYAISLGGDTDTIASMAGSLAGAYYGAEIIPENLIKHCEGHDAIIDLATKLHEINST